MHFFGVQWVKNPMPILAAVTFCALVGLQNDPARQAYELVEKLSSAIVEERETAVLKLADAGTHAIPALERASRSADPEVVFRAASLLAAIRFTGSASASFRSAFPDATRRLAGGSRAWLALFLAAAPPDAPARSHPADLAELVGPASRAAAATEEKSAVARAIGFHDIHEGRDALLGWLGDKDAQVRKAAISGILGIHAKDLGPRLIPLLDDPHPEVKAEAFEALHALRTPLSAKILVAHFEDGGLGYDRTAARIMLDLGVKEAIPVALRLVKENDNGVGKVGVGLALIEGLQATEAIPELVDRVKQEDSRQMILWTLSALGAVDGMKGLLESPDTVLRTETLQAFGRLRSPGAAELVRKHLKAPSANHRAAAAMALGMMGATEAVPDLMEVLKSSEGEVAATAAFSLADMHAREAVPVFLGWLKNGPDRKTSIALEALWRLGTPEAVPGLASRLEHPDRTERWCALKMLGASRAKEAAPAVVTRLNDKDSSVRFQALRTLGRVGRREHAVAVAPLLDSKDGNESVAAALTLGALGAEDSRDSVIRRLWSTGRNHFYGYAQALRGLGAKESIATFRKTLREGPVSERATAITVLSILDAEEAIADVLAVLHDPTPEIRRAAASFLVGRSRQEGLRGFIAAGEGLEWLNRYRTPSIWKKLESLPAPQVRQGFHRDRALQAAKAVGLKLEWAACLTEEAYDGPAGHEGGVESWEIEESANTMLDTLWNSVNQERTFILEADRIRVLPTVQARIFWREWFHMESKR